MLKNYFQRFKSKWGIQSNWQLTKVMLVFALAGQSILFVMPLVRNFFGLPDDINFFWKAIFFVFVSFPIYQILLLFWSLILWEHKFFIFFIKNTFKKTAKLFQTAKKDSFF